MLTRPGWSLARGARPRPWVGVAVVVGSVAACTVAIYPLAQVAPVVSLSVVYLVAVLLVSANWGLAFGLWTALLSAAAFDFFHLPPVGQFTITDSRDWVSLGAFTVVAVAVSAIAELARASALESERRRGAAEMPVVAPSRASSRVGLRHLKPKLVTQHGPRYENSSSICARLQSSWFRPQAMIRTGVPVACPSLLRTVNRDPKGVRGVQRLHTHEPRRKQTRRRVRNRGCHQPLDWRGDRRASGL